MVPEGEVVGTQVDVVADRAMALGVEVHEQGALAGAGKAGGEGGPRESRD